MNRTKETSSGVPRQLQAQGGTAVSIKLTSLDIARLSHMKAFYQRHLNINPSTAAIVRWLIREHMRFIDGLIDLSGFLDLQELPEVKRDKFGVMAAAKVMELEYNLPKIPSDTLPTFEKRLEGYRQEEAEQFKEELREHLSDPQDQDEF